MLKMDTAARSAVPGRGAGKQSTSSRRIGINQKEKAELTMETTLRTINQIIACLFFICYAYQFIYIPVALFKNENPCRRQRPTAMRY